jgi:hypothetical protein
MHRLRFYIKLFAEFVSILFHPLWWSTYGLYLLLLLNPYLFGVRLASERSSLLIQVFVLTFVLPVFSIFLLKKLGFIQSYRLTERIDRIGPYLVTLVFYFWLYINIRHDAQIPLVYTIFVLGALITLIGLFIANLFIKLSAHTAVMGGVIAMTWITFTIFSPEAFTLRWQDMEPVSISWRTVLISLIGLAGLIGSCRLYLEAHHRREIYLGYLIGIISQGIAFKFLF